MIYNHKGKYHNYTVYITDVSKFYIYGFITWEENNYLHVHCLYSYQTEYIINKFKDTSKSLILHGSGFQINSEMYKDYEINKIEDNIGLELTSIYSPYSTFMSLGCPNNCSWCFIPKIHNKCRPIENNKIAPFILDPNILALGYNYFKKVVNKLKKLSYCRFMYFDASLFTKKIASELAELHHGHLTFACDTIDEIPYVYNAVLYARQVGFKNIFVVALVNHKEDTFTTWHRLNLLHKLNINITISLYCGVDNNAYEHYKSSNWSNNDVLYTHLYYIMYNSIKEHKTFLEFKSSIPENNIIRLN
jgi:hypothetical protein